MLFHHNMRLFPPLSAVLWVLLWCAVPMATPPTVAHAAGDPSYLAELTQRAADQKLAESRYWQVLMHYRPTIFGGVRSEVDGRSFFAAKDGDRNPRAELAATLARFFDPPFDDPALQHPQCYWPGRYQWLAAELDFDPARLPPRPCPRYRQWRAGLNASGVVVVFPAAYLNNPASMYGHTFLRLDNPDRPDLLDYAVNYAAETGPGGDPLFALKGIFGAYPGAFSVMPYYAKVQGYGELENRDIWEYRLNLSAAQVDRLMAHLWELRETYFDYYFFRENCSYHLLSLLEAADPNLHLRERFKHWTIPTDTLRLLEAQPGLVADIGYRAARSTVLVHRLNSLDRAEVSLGMALATGTREVVFPDGGDTGRWANALALADDYLLYQEAAKGLDEAAKQRHHRILLTMSRLDVAPANDLPMPTAKPHQGHATQRLFVGLGKRFGEGHLVARYRAAYHDLLDPEFSYGTDSQLTFFDIEGRYYPAKDRLELSRLTVLDIVSIYPWNPVLKKKSWFVSLGWRSLEDRACRQCGAMNLDAGVGTAVRTPPGGRLARHTAVILADASVQYADRLRHDHALGVGPEVKFLSRWAAGLKTDLSARYLGYWAGERYETRRLSAQLAWQIAPSVALRLNWQRIDGRGGVGRIGNLSVHLYY